MPLHNGKVIDLNFELPKIKQAIKENSVLCYQNFNKELNKNKTPGDIRKQMVNNKYLSDVKFIVAGSTFHAHKMILITASCLFYEHFQVKGEKELKVESVDPETFLKVISYCYTDKIQVNENDVLELLLAANKLQVRQITNICHGFISNMMSPESIFIIFDKALELENELFQKKCLDFINKNEAKCFTSKGFFAISLPSLMKILEVCKYPREKTSEIIEKWTNGAMGFTDETPAPIENKKPTGAAKKPQAKKKQQTKQPPGKNQIPDLMSLPIPRPPMVPPFPFPPPQFEERSQQFGQQPPNFGQQPFPYSINPIRPFAGSSNVGPLINFDDDDDRESIISKDDDNESKLKVAVVGARHQWATEFSRLDFVCKRSMLIHEIWFSENLAPKCKEVRLTVSVFEGNKRSDIHNRTIVNNKPGESARFVAREV